MTLIKRIRDNFSKYPVFTNRDIQIAMPDSSSEAIRQILSYMARRGEIYRVRSGRYSFSRDSSISGFAFRPFYYGLESALTYRELWDQLTRPCIITTNAVKKNQARVFGQMQISLHHIPKKYFFGFGNMQYGGLSIPVSDPEKTLIDLFYYRRRLAVQNYGGLLRAVKAAKVNEYLRAYDGHTQAAVKNFLYKYKELADQGKLGSEY